MSCIVISTVRCVVIVVVVVVVVVVDINILKKEEARVGDVRVEQIKRKRTNGMRRRIRLW